MEYMPSLVGTILLLEDDYESKPATFDRDLQSLIHQPGFDGVKGLVIGRFQNKSEMEQEMLVKETHLFIKLCTLCLKTFSCWTHDRHPNRQLRKDAVHIGQASFSSFVFLT
ncbi:MAG: hypothetical protein MUO77_21765, partial [Anaerolineales bacterium]|nr:hypothetical protein [Anaerolineales bacterium]